jgi:lipoprotein NlpI
VWAELPDGQVKAHAAFTSGTKFEKMPLTLAFCGPVLLLLGQKQEALKTCQKLRPAKELLPPGRRDWYLKLLDFNCGNLTEEKLLETAGTHLWDLCEGHYYIGLHHLADGETLAAKEHFEASAATNVYWYWEYIWSRLFLARMKKDGEWPRWIAKKC